VRVATAQHIHDCLIDLVLVLLGCHVVRLGRKVVVAVWCWRGRLGEDWCFSVALVERVK
jgi:hypothetical protein